jgi:hypothetical protein
VCASPGVVGQSDQPVDNKDRGKRPGCDGNIVTSPFERALFLLDHIACGDWRRFAEQADQRAIAGGGKLNGTRDRLGIDVGASRFVENYE